MSGLVVGLVLALVALWVRARSRRRRVLAGIESGRPVFHVDPPLRRMGNRSDGRL